MGTRQLSLASRLAHTAVKTLSFCSPSYMVALWPLCNLPRETLHSLILHSQHSLNGVLQLAYSDDRSGRSTTAITPSSVRRFASTIALLFTPWTDYLRRTNRCYCSVVRVKRRTDSSFVQVLHEIESACGTTFEYLLLLPVSDGHFSSAPSDESCLCSLNVCE